MVDMSRPLDLDSPDADEFLRGIQGNIIKGHGRAHTAHILVTMTGDPAAVRGWVAAFAAEQVTTAHRAREAAATRKADGGDSEPFAMFLLKLLGGEYFFAPSMAFLTGGMRP